MRRCDARISLSKTPWQSKKIPATHSTRTSGSITVTSVSGEPAKIDARCLETLERQVVKPYAVKVILHGRLQTSAQDAIGQFSLSSQLSWRRKDPKFAEHPMQCLWFGRKLGPLFVLPFHFEGMKKTPMRKHREWVKQTSRTQIKKAADDMSDPTSYRTRRRTQRAVILARFSTCFSLSCERVQQQARNKRWTRTLHSQYVLVYLRLAFPSPCANARWGWDAKMRLSETSICYPMCDTTMQMEIGDGPGDYERWQMEYGKCKRNKSM